jgi:hypothetical protein
VYWRKSGKEVRREAGEVTELVNQLLVVYERQNLWNEVLENSPKAIEEYRKKNLPEGVVVYTPAPPLSLLLFYSASIFLGLWSPCPPSSLLSPSLVVTLVLLGSPCSPPSLSSLPVPPLSSSICYPRPSLPPFPLPSAPSSHFQ